MSKLFAQVYRVIRITRWLFSTDRRILRDYLNRIGNLESLSDSDWSKFQEVAEIKKTTFAHN